MEEDLEEALAEFLRYRDTNVAVPLGRDVVDKRFRTGHVNKLGLIVKETEGKRKVRIVVDMRRPRANPLDYSRCFELSGQVGSSALASLGGPLKPTSSAQKGTWGP